MIWAPPLVVGRPDPLQFGPQAQPTLGVLDSGWEMGRGATVEGEARIAVLFFVFIFSLMCRVEKMTLIKQRLQEANSWLQVRTDRSG